MRATFTAIIFLALGVSQSANANLQVNFYESAPKDSFIIKNIGSCNLNNVNIEIDLSNSQGKLIFDTTATGAGVEVFQPFEVKSGKLELVSSGKVADGDKSLSVVVENLGPDETVSFTIDVDDTMPESSLGQIRVAGSEVQGAQVRVTDGDAETVEGSFTAKKVAMVKLPACV